MIFIRSLLFNVSLYLVTGLTLLLTAPVYFFLPHAGSLAIVKWLAGACTFLAKHVAGIGYEIRGLENVPAGPSIVAAQHQSMWETFALIPLFRDPAFVIKAELLKVPLWGAFSRKTDMIYVDRSRGRQALKDMAAGTERAKAKGRTVILFPEGTRAPPGDVPDIKVGLTYLYKVAKLPVVPVALNSGFYWPRNVFLRHPGTVIVQFLPPILPGLTTDEFQAEFAEAMGTASDRLVLEADAARPRPPFPPEATARLGEIKARLQAKLPV